MAREGLQGTARQAPFLASPGEAHYLAGAAEQVRRPRGAPPALRWCNQAGGEATGRNWEEPGRAGKSWCLGGATSHAPVTSLYWGACPFKGPREAEPGPGEGDRANGAVQSGEGNGHVGEELVQLGGGLGGGGQRRPGQSQASQAGAGSQWGQVRGVAYS